MRLFNDQHEFYCGIDLHAKSMHACIVDAAGNKRLHRNFANSKPEAWLRTIARFRNDLVIGCESTFNWYWLADLCEQQQLPFILGHAFYMKAIHGGKTKSDAIDSEKLARVSHTDN